MANLHVSAQPLVPRSPYGPGVGNAPNSLRAARDIKGQKYPFAEDAASAFEGVQSTLNSLQAALQKNTPVFRQVYVTDNSGKVIAAIGDFTYQGVITPNYFSEIHVGDPLNTGNPAQALFNAADGRVTIGQNGSLDVLDPFGQDAAWIGTQADTLPVSGAVDNGAGLIRLTVTGHTLQTGDSTPVLNVGGVPNATGIRTVTVIDADTLDLQNTVFVGTYTSGGTVNRLLHITGAADNGSGLIRVTITAHGYESGDKSNIENVGGVPNAAGQWILKVIDADHFDLVGSTFAGAYTSGGTSLRYFAGGNFETFAIGGFTTYSLRAFADGSLRIRNATIELSSAGGDIVLDPSGPSIILSSPDSRIVLDASVPAMTVEDDAGNVWGAIETITEAPKAITATTNGSPDVITIAAHGYVNGDTLMVAGSTGDTAINGNVIVQAATTNNFTLTNLSGTPINGNGAYAGGGTATRYYSGGLFQSFAIGPSWANANLRAYADGRMTINGATFTLTLNGATVEIDSIGAGPANTGVKISDPADDARSFLSAFQLFLSKIAGTGATATLTLGELIFTDSLGNSAIDITEGTGIILNGSRVVSAGGFINTGTGYRVGGVPGIAASIVLAKLTVGGANGLLGVSGGMIVSLVPPT